MALSVCLLLDESADRAVRALWRRLADDGLPSLATYTHGRHVPHLTLAALADVDAEAALPALAPGPDAPVAATLQALATFTRSRGSLAPAPGRELLARHAQAVGALDAAGCTVHRHYRPGTWLPHVTVTPRLPVEQLPALARRAFEVLPLDVVLGPLVLVDTGTGDVLRR
ncbi:MAG: 2'-5' RNA ligase family protein [Nocardioidaceae bacterium]|nr:2'-5' RNA ligase family protein [Nocardioidaceae bacterium]